METSATAGQTGNATASGATLGSNGTVPETAVETTATAGQTGHATASGATVGSNQTAAETAVETSATAGQTAQATTSAAAGAGAGVGQLAQTGGDQAPLAAEAFLGAVLALIGALLLRPRDFLRRLLR